MPRLNNGMQVGDLAYDTHRLVPCEIIRIEENPGDNPNVLVHDYNDDYHKVWGGHLVFLEDEAARLKARLAAIEQFQYQQRGYRKLSDFV